VADYLDMTEGEWAHAEDEEKEAYEDLSIDASDVDAVPPLPSSVDDE
jgi:hypothetical protein